MEVCDPSVKTDHDELIAVKSSVAYLSSRVLSLEQSMVRHETKLEDAVTSLNKTLISIDGKISSFIIAKNARDTLIKNIITLGIPAVTTIFGAVWFIIERRL